MSLSERALELVRIQSVYGNEKELADFVEAWGRNLYKEVIRDGNAVVFRDDPSAVVLAGHLDTVAPPEGELAAPSLKDGKVIGLGSTDMKGGLAVMMELVERGKRPTLALYDKEEGPDADNGLRRVLAHIQQAPLAICMEPTSNAVQVGCLGGLHATVTFRGKAAHSARPWLGENAIHKAAALLSALAARERNEVDIDGLKFYEVIVATVARDGELGRTTIPSRFELNLNSRFAPNRTLDDAEAELRALVGDEAEIEVTDRAPPGKVCLDNERVQALLDLTGTPPEPKQAWTDVARFTEAGIDAVNFGPGNPALAHQAGEFVAVEALERSFEILDALL